MTKPSAASRNFPWLGLQIVCANLAVAGILSVIGFLSFRQQSDLYLHRLMKKFDISPSDLHSMYVADVQQALWVALIIAVVVAVVLAVGLAILIIRPLLKLSNVTQAVAAGDLSARAPSMRGELGQLSQDFNSMVSALDEEEGRRRRYLADLAHEIRTPVTTLRGYAEGLEDGIFKPEPKTFAIMRQECDHLAALVSKVDLMTNFSFDHEDEQQGCRLDAVVAEALERWKPRLDEAGLKVENSGNGKVVSRLSAGTAQRILDNLLSNACRYAPADQPLRLKLESRAGERAKLRLSNGVGDLKPEQVALFFDRFYRVDQSRTRLGSESGEIASGLGLAIVRETLVRNGGSATAFIEGDRLVFELLL